MFVFDLKSREEREFVVSYVTQLDFITAGGRERIRRCMPGGLNLGFLGERGGVGRDDI